MTPTRPLARPLPGTLRRFVLQSAIWTALCFPTEIVCRIVLHLGYPYDYPAVPFSVVFGDFRFWVKKFASFHSPQFFTTGNPLMYPAPVVATYRFFLIAPLHPQNAFFVTLRLIAVMLAFSLILLYAFRRALIRRGLAVRPATLFVLAVYALSFPFWFEVHQANMEFVVWVVVTLGIWSFWTKKPWWAATFFGVAAAMKLFPIVFLGLLLVRRQYRQMAWSIVVAAATTIASLWLVCPDIRTSWRQTNAAVAQFRTMYMLQLRPIETGFDHSLFCLFKRLLPTLPGPVPLGHLLSVYLLTAAIAGVVLFFIRIRKLPVANQVLCLTLAAILLPPTSYDYTLLHLYAPFALLVFAVIKQGPRRPGDASLRGQSFAFFLLAFLLSAQSEFIFHGLRFAGQLKAVALVLLWLVALVFPFRTEQDAAVEPLALPG